MEAMALHSLWLPNSFFLFSFLQMNHWIKLYPLKILKQLTHLEGKAIWAMWHCLSILHTSWEAGFVTGPCGTMSRYNSVSWGSKTIKDGTLTGWWNCRRNPRLNLPAQKNQVAIKLYRDEWRLLISSVLVLWLAVFLRLHCESLCSSDDLFASCIFLWYFRGFRIIFHISNSKLVELVITEPGRWTELKTIPHVFRIPQNSWVPGARFLLSAYLEAAKTNSWTPQIP